VEVIVDEQALSITRVATILDVHERTARRLIETGELKGHKIRRQWRVFRPDLQDFLARAAHGPQSTNTADAAA
jgi:excisionase family DNA binding protein